MDLAVGVVELNEVLVVYQSLDTLYMVRRVTTVGIVVRGNREYASSTIN